ncbi:hypothetical protein [Streptomyces sp. NPDC056169]|uniref:hypothetical protein n=1 Tax=Streptomyces sp. NPDC056169 TaxID=3345734 RepID=UPI0035E16FD7
MQKSLPVAGAAGAALLLGAVKRTSTALAGCAAVTATVVAVSRIQFTETAPSNADQSVMSHRKVETFAEHRGDADRRTSGGGTPPACRPARARHRAEGQVESRLQACLKARGLTSAAA